MTEIETMMLAAWDLAMDGRGRELEEMLVRIKEAGDAIRDGRGVDYMLTHHPEYLGLYELGESDEIWWGFNLYHALLGISTYLRILGREDIRLKVRRRGPPGEDGT